MPVQSTMSPLVKNHVVNRGGKIWKSTLTGGNVGTGTTQADLTTTFPVPGPARTLLGWRPLSYPDNQASGEGSGIIFSLGGDHFQHRPCEVIGGNIASSVLTDSAGALHAQSEYYDAFIPVSGKEDWTVSAEALDAVAGNQRAMVEFTWTNIRVSMPIIYSLMSRETAVSAAGLTALTTLSPTKCHHIIEADAATITQVLTVEEETMGEIKYESALLAPVQTDSFGLEPVGALADLSTDNGSVNSYVTRRPNTWLQAKETSLDITCNIDLDQALTSAAAVAWGLRWV